MTRVIKVTPEEVEAARIEVRALRAAGLVPDPMVVKLANAGPPGGKLSDPLLVHGMRRWPTGEVRHLPDDAGMSGTSTRGFLAEYDEALAEAYQRGYRDGRRGRQASQADDYQ